MHNSVTTKNKNKKTEPDYTQPEDLLNELRPSRIILPIALGLGVVAFLIYREFNIESLEAINWRFQTAIFFVLAIVCAMVRQFAYMWRIRVLTDGELSWKKAFQIIAIWEFSSSVTPTMVGGTAVGLYMLTKEKFSLGRSTTIILSTIVVDSTFFLLTTAFFWLIYGNCLIVPDFCGNDAYNFFTDSYWTVPFISAFSFMFLYTVTFAYGLFVNPETFKWLLNKMTSWRLTKRWNTAANKMGNDIILASDGIKNSKWTDWAQLYLSTALAWSTRFGVVIFLILAIMEVSDLFLLYARQLVLYLILVLTPTPGGSGMAEFAFGHFYSDIILDRGLAKVVGAFWRLLTYYPYLILGVFVLPVWVARIYGKKKK